MQIGSRRCILNPQSGDGDHASYLPRLMRARGFEVYETEYAEHAVELARAVGEAGASEVAVCGGDGTVNEVIRGLHDADHLDSVTLSVVPVGTANLLARMIGVGSVEDGVEIADTGTTRTVDVGFADGEPFLVSCIAGLPADASVATSSELKARFGTLAFLVTGTQEALEFDGLEIEIEATNAEGSVEWHGEALCLLVGNARRFVGKGGQADMEDGLLDVAIVEQMPPGNLVAEAVTHRILGDDSDRVTHLRASDLTVHSQNGAITFSRDGELASHDELTLSVERQLLDLRVGDEYVPDPV